MRRFWQYTLMLLIAAALILFLVLPVFLVIAQGLRWQLLQEVFSNPVYGEGLLNSLKIALCTTGIVFLIALPLALLFDCYDFAGKGAVGALMMLPMLLPPFVGALGFRQLLGHYGILNSLLRIFGFAPVDFLGSGGFWAVCWIEALHLYPILYWNLTAALGNVDPSLYEAARNCGAGPWTRLWKITLPLLKNGILSGGSIVLIWSFTEMGTPLMFGYNRTTPVQIFNGLTELVSNPLPFSLVVILLAASSLLYLLSRLALHGTSGVSAKGIAGMAAQPLRGVRAFPVQGAFLLTAICSVLPHAALVGCAFFQRYYGTILPEHFTVANFTNALSSPFVLPAIFNSLRYSVFAMLAALATGIIVGFAVERWKLRGGLLLDMLAMLPLAVPGIVVAFGYLGMASRYAWAHRIFDPTGNPIYLLGVAYAVRRLPYVVRSVSAGLSQLPEDFEDAARNLGSSEFRTLQKITLPLIAANLTVGALFAFSFSMLEVSDSLLLAQKVAHYPITKALYELSQIVGEGQWIACAFGVWAMLFLACTLLLAAAILGKKIGAVFKL